MFSNEDSLDQDENSQLRNEKARLEVQIARNEVESHRSKIKLEKQKVWLTFLTAFIGITGLFITFYSQRNQLNLLQKQQFEDSYIKKVELFTNSHTETAKLAAIIALLGYVEPDVEESIRIRTISLLGIAAESDTLNSVRSLIKSELVRRDAKATLVFLAQQNRELLKEAGSNWFIVANQDTSDSATKNLNRRLIWNIETLSNCIRKLKVIENFDFSGVVFGSVNYSISRTVRDSAGTDNSITHIERVRKVILQSLNQQLESVVFNRVKFSYAQLNGLKFKNVTFMDSNFDNSCMINTEFESSRFDEHCSFKHFYWSTDYGIDAAELEQYYPVWRNSEIKGSEFMPFDTVSTGPVFRDTTFFKNSSWSFNKPFNNGKILIKRSGKSVGSQSPY
ncbi:hypothetical protein AAFN85_13620 [Mucilaginibacter sp. CAU 1740]|uniref:hypothetical protein n=1 Tax=Mucilaginibacter sp. CAU 1740 TaxID=3140365 RepID=UPI00325C25BA